MSKTVRATAGEVHAKEGGKTRLPTGAFIAWQNCALIGVTQCVTPALHLISGQMFDDFMTWNGRSSLSSKTERLG